MKSGIFPQKITDERQDTYIRAHKALYHTHRKQFLSLSLSHTCMIKSRMPTRECRPGPAIDVMQGVGCLHKLFVESAWSVPVSTLVRLSGGSRGIFYLCLLKDATIIFGHDDLCLGNDTALPDAYFRVTFFMSFAILCYIVLIFVSR